jgi:predicted TIM-barrel fold metal-dependent hydrolase
MATATNRIDVHVHAIPPFFKEATEAVGYSATISTGYPTWTKDQALALMERQGIATSILSPSQPGLHFGDDGKARTLARKYNEFYAELIAEAPQKWGAYAAVPLPDIDGALSEIEFALDQLKLDGVGLLASYGNRFLGDPEFEPVLTLLNEREAVVLIHPNFHPSSRALKMTIPAFLAEFPFDTTRAVANLIFGGALERFPKIRFILSHSGGAVPYLAWRFSVSTFIEPRFKHLTPEKIMSYCRQFYYEVAQAAGRPTLSALREVADPDRILFGTDWPYCPEPLTEYTIECVDDVHSEDARQRDRIYRSNALKLFPRFATSRGAD